MFFFFLNLTKQLCDVNHMSFCQEGFAQDAKSATQINLYETQRSAKKKSSVDIDDLGENEHEQHSTSWQLMQNFIDIILMPLNLAGIW